MTLHLYKCFPYLLIYTDNLPECSGGCANGPVVRIRNKYRDDKGIEMHEAEHVRQWWKTLGLHSLLYLLSKKYRLKAEVEAYKEQLKWMGWHSDRLPGYYEDLYATWLSIPEPEGYELQDIVTKEKALQLLKEGW